MEKHGAINADTPPEKEPYAGGNFPRTLPDKEAADRPTAGHFTRDLVDAVYRRAGGGAKKAD